MGLLSCLDEDEQLCKKPRLRLLVIVPRKHVETAGNFPQREKGSFVIAGGTQSLHSASDPHILIPIPTILSFKCQSVAI